MNDVVSFLMFDNECDSQNFFTVEINNYGNEIYNAIMVMMTLFFVRSKSGVTQE